MGLSVVTFTNLYDLEIYERSRKKLNYLKWPEPISGKSWHCPSRILEQLIDEYLLLGSGDVHYVSVKCSAYQIYLLTLFCHLSWYYLD